MQAARFVVDKGDAAADHGHDENGHGNRAGEQILDVFDVGIKFDDLQIHEGIQAGQRDGQALSRLKRVESLIDVLHQILHAGEDFGGDEIVRVVLDESDARAVSLVDSARIVDGNIDHGADEPRAQIDDGVGNRIVILHLHRLRPGHDGVKALAEVARVDGAVLVHDRDFDPFDFSAERVPEDDELHQRKNHGAHHQRGAAEKFPHVAFDDGGDALKFHLFRAALYLYRWLTSRRTVSEAASRSWRPV